MNAKGGPRYLIVAAICMAVHNLIMILGDRAGVAMPLSVMISFGTVVLVGFLLHSRFTFAQKSEGRGLLRYALAMAANVPLTIVSLWLLTEPIGWPMALAAPVATIVMLSMNFFFTRWALHPRRGAAA